MRKMTDEELALFRKKYPDRTMPRSCDSCYVCCVFLGINSLQKHAGEACKHLTGANGPDKRCSIYANRPDACSTYGCGWLEGLGSDNMRPNQSGVLISLYPPRLHKEHASCTIHIVDENKAGSLTHGPLYDAIQEVLNFDINDLVVVNLRTKRVVHFRQGNIYKGKLLKQDAYEDLSFETNDTPFGSYHMREQAA